MGGGTATLALTSASAAGPDEEVPDTVDEEPEPAAAATPAVAVVETEAGAGLAPAAAGVPVVNQSITSMASMVSMLPSTSLVAFEEEEPAAEEVGSGPRPNPMPSSVSRERT
jgi:hypothetical protein